MSRLPTFLVVIERPLHWPFVRDIFVSLMMVQAGCVRTSRIQNCHWNSILSRISMRKTGKHPQQVKLRGLYMANIYYRHWVFSPDMPPKYPLKHPFSCKLLFWLIIVGLFEALLSPPDVITRCFRCFMLNIHYIGK